MEGSYEIVYMEKAQAHLEHAKKSGKGTLLKKIFALVAEIEAHPRTGTGHPKPLRHHKGEVWARKISSGDRLVYEIFEDRKLVTINRALGHYEDK